VRCGANGHDGRLESLELTHEIHGCLDATASVDRVTHQLQAIEPALHEIDGGGDRLALAAGDAREQRLDGVREIAHGHDPGHARAALQRVQVALQRHDGGRVAVLTYGLQRGLGLIENLGSFLRENSRNLGIERGRWRSSSGLGGGRGGGRSRGLRDGESVERFRHHRIDGELPAAGQAVRQSLDLAGRCSQRIDTLGGEPRTGFEVAPEMLGERRRERHYRCKSRHACAAE